MDKEKLFLENKNLIHYTINKFYNIKFNGLEYDDYFQIGSIGLWKAILTFKKEKKAKLSTYAIKCIRNEILYYLRKTKKESILNDSKFIYEIKDIDSDGNERYLIDTLASNKCEVSIDEAD